MSRAEERGVTVVDPLTAVENVLDRRTLRRKLPDLLARTDGRVAWSDSLEVPDHGAALEQTNALQRLLQQSDGLLIKPCVACGISESHEMCLVRTAEALPQKASLLLMLLQLEVAYCRPCQAIWATRALSRGPGSTVFACQLPWVWYRAAEAAT